MNDEILTFYYYNDGLTQAERAKVANLLATDPAVAARYQKLCRQMDCLSTPASIPPRPDMVERWHDSLNRAVHAKNASERKPVIHTWSFIWGAAITAALAIGIGIGVVISSKEAELTVTPDTMVARNPNSGAFVRGLQVHLRESGQGLSEMPIAATSDRVLLIQNIMQQNRLYEKVARQNNSQDLARVLRAFDLVLMRLAADDITPQEAEALQTKFLFELNVVLTKLARNTSEESEVI